MNLNIRKIVNESDTSAGRAFDIVVLILIFLSVVILSIDTLPNLSPDLRGILHVSEIAITVLFAIEYGLRVITAPKKTNYIFSFYGIIDFVAIFPFWILFPGFDSRLLRAFRLIRVFRILKLARYSSTMDRFGKALSYAKEEILIFLFATIILIYISAAGIYYFEHKVQPEPFKSIFHSLWWAVATITTIGYDDIYPMTVGGKLFTFLMMMCGLSVIAVPSGIVAKALLMVVRLDK